MFEMAIDKDCVEPAYKQVKRKILEKIDAGHLAPGARVPSVRALSQMSGVSCGTVAKAIAELTRESHLKGRGRKGLVVAERDSLSIGITGAFKERTFFNDRYYHQIMAGIETALHPGHYALTFRTMGDPLDRTFDGFRVDGVLTLGVGIIEARWAELLRWNGKLPVMVIGAWTMPDDRLSYVVSDSVADSRRAVECLLRAGHRRIAGIFHSHRSARLEGYRQALARAGIESDDRLVILRDDAASLDAELERVAGLRPAAVFDSVGSIWPSLAAKLPAKNPALAVATYRDDPREWVNSTVPHVIVRQPLQEMGRAAAERLTGMIERREQRVIQAVLQSEIINCLDPAPRPEQSRPLQKLAF